jgi:hydrogenase nickel incorporation protein HypA/HybF
VHELSVCQAMIGQVETIAADRGVLAVKLIRIRIGPLSGVVPELLERAFPLAAAGSVAEGAQLNIEAAPIRVRCETCGAETEAAANRLLCGACGDWHTRLISGDELLLESVELDMEMPHASPLIPRDHV